jgi:hypothetical protein
MPLLGALVNACLTRSLQQPQFVAGTLWLRLAAEKPS